MTPEEFNQLAAECSKIFDIHTRDLLGPAKFGFIMPARFALYKSLKLRGKYHTEIASFCNRDPKTILNGIRRADSLIALDHDYEAKVNHLANFRTFQ